MAFFISILLSPIIGIVIALVQKPNEAVVEKRRLQTGASRKCPFCAELIKKEARVCRYCGRDISPSDEETAPPANITATSPAITDESKDKFNAWGFTVFVVLAGGLIIGGIITLNTQSHGQAKVAATNENAVEPAPTRPPQFVTITRSLSLPLQNGTDVLPVGTQLEFVSQKGSEVHIRYRDGEYAIPISATDLK